MKTFQKIFLIAALLGTSLFSAQAQQITGKYTVSTHLKEKQGTYEQRKLYREFLEDFMKKCPYISHFSIHETLGDSNNHDVVWSYEVNGWNDITHFYGWVTDQLKSKDNGLKKAMTPYQPDYAIGGQISLEKTGKTAKVKNNTTTTKTDS